MNLKRHFRRPSTATALAGTALLVAVASSPVGEDVAQAAQSLITGAQIKNETVTTSDVKNRSLRARDFALGELPRGPRGQQGPKGEQGSQGERGPQGGQGERGPQGGQGERGPQGERGSDGSPGGQGPKGDTGPQGPQGIPGVSGYEIVTGENSGTEETMGANAYCPSGKRMLGGGFTRSGVEDDDDFEVVTNYPTTQQNAWQVFAKYEGGGGDHWTIKAWAICATVR